MSDISKRKESHIKLSKEPSSQMEIGNPFEKYTLPYQALPELDLAKVSIKKKLFGIELNQPLIIASMTGGSEHARTINKNLALAAQETKVALGVGSQRITLVNEDAKETFSLVRKYAPDAFIFSNIGAVQLNYGVTSKEINKIVDLVRADALYLHLNPLQEALQPEGDTNFSKLLPKIEKLVKDLDIPVFVKEVGHGISAEVAKELFNIGILNIDVAGAGGTSWAWIEAKRRNNTNFEQWFKNYGIPTDEAIISINKIRPKGVTLVASGGIRSPLDGLKAICLGANYYSGAKPFLDPAMQNNPDQLISLINDWEYAFRVGVFLMGKSDVEKVSHF